MDLSLETRVAILIEALPFIQNFRGHTFVIKYGGSAMDDPRQVDRLLRDIVFLEAVGINPVVVHGGGKAISQRMREAGLETRFVNGLRITDEQCMRLVEETLDKVINPQIVETICKFGGKAKGISGKDVFVANLLGPQPDEKGKPVDIGFVGEARGVETEAVEGLIGKEIVPVISPIGAARDGTVLNINADVAAAALATELRASKLIFVSDVPGILRNPADPQSLIPSLKTSDIPTLLEDQVIAGGMIPKVRSAANAAQNGVGKVHMVCGGIAHCLLLEIFTKAGIGTEIVEAPSPN